MNIKWNLWCFVWMIASFIGLIAVILGYYHHIVSVFISLLMMAVCGIEDNNQSK